LGGSVDDLEAVMPRARTSAEHGVKVGSPREVPVVPREYAGKWIAWSADGRRIVAVGESFEACEQTATRAGFPADRIAIERVPETRYRQTGAGM
jgi:hypothetical protein